jgi:ATP-binding cassette subfamily B protein
VAVLSHPVARPAVGLGEVLRVVRGAGTIVKVSARANPRIFALLCTTTFLLGALPVTVAIASAQVVRTVPIVSSQGLDSAAGDDLVVAMSALGAFFVARSVVTYVGGTFARTMARRLDDELRARTMRAAMSPATVLHLEDDDWLRAFDAARNLSPLGITPGMAVEALGPVLAVRLEALGYCAVVAWYSWPFGLLFLAVVIFGHAEMHRLMMTQIRQAYFLDNPTEAFYFRDLAVTPQAAKELRVFGLGDWIGDRYRESMLGFLHRSWRTRGIFSPSLGAMVVLTGGTTIGGLMHFGFAGVRGDLDLGSVTLAVTAVFLLSPRVVPEDIRVAYGSAAVPAILAAEAVARDLVARPAGNREVAGVPARSICFEDVTFRYRGRDEDVLHGLTLELRAGERTALVGVNGAGKTTVVKLLCRLYEPTSGRITVDGIPLDELRHDRWQRQLAVLFQDFVRYELSAHDNVRYGALQRAGTEAEVRRAAARIGADRVVDALGDGWATQLSSRFTGGADLSGGEWQRVAFARALYAVDGGARVLVLDEPTANLDVRAEAELYEQFLELTSHEVEGTPLTTLVVSHRLSTVRRADRIVVLDGGVVAEDGTHDSLLATGGLYARMFHAQAARFADSPAGP